MTALPHPSIDTTCTQDGPELKAGDKGRRYQWSRSTVHKLLTTLRGGSIHICDTQGEVTLGNQSDNDAISVKVEILDMSCYRDILWGGNLGVADAYIAGKWRCNDLPGLIRLFCRNMTETTRMNEGIARLKSWVSTLAHRLARNSITGSRKNIAAHYDLSNEFFQLFLDPTMMYSSAYFRNTSDTLEQASIQKLNLICQKLNLNSEDHLLEIGTGWGGLALHAASHFGCRVTTTTISSEQYELAKQRISQAGFSDRITLLKEDYRNLTGEYDKLVSVEMIEAVGHQYFPTYFEKCHELLKPGGHFLMQAITIPDHRYEVYRNSVDFIQKYIFPGGLLPSIGALLTANQRTNLRLVASEDFGESYALTLREWRKRFFDQQQQVLQLGFDDRFLRTWDYYFSYCEGAFLEQAVGVSHLIWQKARY